MARNIREQQALLIDGLTEKVTPVSGDLVTIADSADSYKLKKAQAGNLPGGSSSPLTTKGDIYTRNATVDARLPVGTNGQVLSADSGETTGLKWITSTSGGGGGAYNEDKFSTTGSETPGATVNFVLDNTPMTSTNTPSGRALTVFRGGVKLDYAATLTTYNQYYYDSVNNRVQVLAPGSADEYEVVYWSTGVGGQTYLILIEDLFSDSSLHSRWTPTTSGGATVVEGADGLVITLPASIAAAGSIAMDVSAYAEVMRYHRWFAECHITTTMTNAVDASESYMGIRGKGDGVSNKFIGGGITRGSGGLALCCKDDSGGQATTGSSGGSHWFRLRNFGDQIRCDYYAGAHTVDIEGEGYWREYNASRAWYINPQGDTFNYPTQPALLQLVSTQWGSYPGGTATFRKFRFGIL